MSEWPPVPDRLAPDALVALDGLIDGGLSQGPGAAVTEVPPLWHWVYFLDRPRQRDLGPDGHPVPGRPTPPQPGLRRMFAGGRVTTYRPLATDQPASMTTSASAPTHKLSRSGPLWFVSLRSVIEQDGAVAIVEERDIVYRLERDPTAALVGQRKALEVTPVAERAGWDIVVDEPLLFRFSALTFNAHRIHYDLAWAEHEGYGGLVVHGPLQALLMGEALRRDGDSLVGRTFAYRLVAPCVGTQTLRVRRTPGAVHDVCVYDAAGVVTATARCAAVD